MVTSKITSRLLCPKSTLFSITYKMFKIVQWTILLAILFPVFLYLLFPKKCLKLYGIPRIPNLSYLLFLQSFFLIWILSFYLLYPQSFLSSIIYKFFIWILRVSILLAILHNCNLPYLLYIQTGINWIQSTSYSIPIISIFYYLQIFL